MNKEQRARLDAHAIEAHIILASTSTEGEVEKAGDFVLGYTGADLPTYNFFIPLSLTGLTDETLADASAFFRTRDTLYSVSLEEHRVPDGTEYLSKRRYQPLPPQPIVATDSLPTELIQGESFIIREVSTIPDLTVLYTVLEAVYDYTPEEVMLLFPTSQIGRQDIKHFVGFTADEVPVTTGTAIYAGNIVSVWNLSTLDNYRRQGFASALLNYILVSASQAGCDLSLIYATPMGFSLFNALGYKLYALRQWFLPQEVG